MSPDEASAWDERLPGLLGSFDEALAAGRGPDTTSDDVLPPELRARLQPLQDCLKLLEQDRQLFAAAESAAGPSSTGGVLDLSFAPTQLGHFRLLRVLGTGGFGIVYLAEDARLARHVAIKVPRPAALVTPLLRRRFVREARAAARLHHPNIVSVFETGEAGPLCYIVSDYCAGGTLADWLKNQQAPVLVRKAARLTAVIADAIQHAHDHGILHRDLKPGNVLLRFDRGNDPSGPDELGFTPLIADFGLAKFVELAAEVTPPPSSDLFSAASEPGSSLKGMTQGLAGTPEYMAPEQAAEQHDAVGCPTDVYALGAILYQLLTGRPPFSKDEPNILGRIRLEAPTPVRRLRPEVPRDLEAICLKCLQKEPGQRYSSARELAEDLRRWLAGEAVLARPAGTSRRLTKWIRRRPAAAGLIALSLLTIFGLAGSTGWYTWNRAREERRQRRVNYVQQIGQANTILESGDFHGLTELLNGMRPSPGEQDLRGFEWHDLWRSYQEAGVWLSGHEKVPTGIAFSPDGRTLYSSGWEGSSRRWDALTAQPRAILQGHGGSYGISAISRDGATVATLNQDWTVSLWDLAGRLKMTLPVGARVSTFLVFSPAGDTLATNGRDGTALLWDLTTGGVRARLEYGGTVNSVAFAPDGKIVAAGGARDVIRICDVRTGSKLSEFSTPAGANTWALDFAPDGQLLAWGGDSKEVVFLDTKDWQVRAKLTGLGSRMMPLKFSPDGRELAGCATQPAATRHIGAQLWSVAQIMSTPSRQPSAEATLDLPDVGLGALAFSPDGRTLALACSDRQIRLWRPVRRSERPAPMSHAPDEAWAVAFSPDGKLLASAGDNVKDLKCLKMWDPATGKLLWAAAAHTSLVTCLAFSADGRVLASTGHDHRIKLWDPATGREQANFDAGIFHPRCLAFSPDGRLLASAGGPRLPSTGEEMLAHIWEVATGRLVHTLGGHVRMVRGIAFSPDGRHIVTAEEDQAVRVWEVETGRELRKFTDMSEIQCVAYAPDGKSLAWGTQDGKLSRLELATGQVRSFAGRHSGEIRSLSFTPDGRRVVTGGSDGTVRLWDPFLLTELLTLPAGPQPINSVAFSPTGDRLAAASHDGAIKIWHAPRDE